jgi:hypothetical protein
LDFTALTMGIRGSATPCQPPRGMRRREHSKVIGQAVKNLSEGTKSRQPDTPGNRLQACVTQLCEGDSRGLDPF